MENIRPNAILKHDITLKNLALTFGDSPNPRLPSKRRKCQIFYQTTNKKKHNYEYNIIHAVMAQSEKRIH